MASAQKVRLFQQPIKAFALLLQFASFNAAAVAIVDGFDFPVDPNDGWFHESVQDWGDESTFHSVMGLLHPGEDWNWGSRGQDIGKKVYAVAHGEVVEDYPRYLSPTNQSMVVLKHVMPSGRHLYSMYLHVEPVSSLQAGDIVAKGERIATIADMPDDPLDRSHLHFEMRTKPISPYEWPNSVDRDNDLSNGATAYYSDYQKLALDGLDFDPSDYIAGHRQIDWDIVPGTDLELTKDATPRLVELGSKAGAGVASLIVDGATLEPAVWLAMGRNADADLQVRNGGKVTSLSTLGDTVATVKISGQGSRITDEQINLGQPTAAGLRGSTLVSIEDGGSLDAQRLEIQHGNIFVNGPGSRLAAIPDWQSSALFIGVGHLSGSEDSVARVGLSRGASMESDRLYLGSFGGEERSDVVGQLLASGASTEVRVHQDMQIWNGIIDISDGATLTASRAFVGAHSYGRGEVNIGNDSVFDVDLVQIGHTFAPDQVTASPGIVIVDPGGTLRSDSIFIGDVGDLRGSGEIFGNVHQQGGLVAPGSSPGTLKINGDFIQTSGKLLIEIAGLSEGEFDVLHVTGFAGLYGGEIVFDFIDDFVPSVGDLFQFLFAGQGAFIDDEVLYTHRGLATGFDFQVDRTTGELLAIAAPVPEPGALALLTLGIAGIGFQRLRIRTRRQLAQGH